LIAVGQNTKITGVVTYYFNEYQGDKPDIGASIYVLDSTKSDFDYELYNRFNNAQFKRSLLLSYKKMLEENESYIATYGNKKKYAASVSSKEKRNEDYKNTIENLTIDLLELNADTEVKFEELDSIHADMMFGATNTDKLDNIIKRTVDGAGNYSVEVNPGTYYVFMRSNNRRGITVSQALGKIYCKKLTIKENEVKDISHNFTLN
jgi:hypothetical protein